MTAAYLVRDDVANPWVIWAVVICCAITFGVWIGMAIRAAGEKWDADLPILQAEIDAERASRPFDQESM